MALIENTRVPREQLDAIFGEDSVGETLEERARSSKREFVRGQLSLARTSRTGNGRWMSALEALANFGWDTLAQLLEEDTALLVSEDMEPGHSFRQRRLSMQLSIEDVARGARVHADELNALESNARVVSFSEIEKVAVALGMSPLEVSFVSGAGGDRDLAARLRSLSDAEQVRYSPNTVLTFSEAAWVIETQVTLSEWLGLKKAISFEPTGYYGTPYDPVWDVGYELALKTRELLGIGPRDPIHSMIQLLERTLLIPVVQVDLDNRIAGAALESNGSRGIVINVGGQENNVWMRRFTLAHELGHLLWDPTQKMSKVRVDEFELLKTEVRRVRDPSFVEPRANAFAIEFLAPRRAVADVYSTDGIDAVMNRFGISFSAARNHIANALGVSPAELDIEAGPRAKPDSEWDLRESLVNDYFPIPDTKLERRGRFAWTVVSAWQRGLISKESASRYLNTGFLELDRNCAHVLNIHD